MTGPNDPYRRPDEPAQGEPSNEAATPPGGRPDDDGGRANPYGSAPGQPYGGAPQPAYGTAPQPPYGTAPGQPWGQQGWGQPTGPKRNGLGIAALVVGIVALLLCWTIIGGVLLGLAAIVLGVLGRGRVKRGEADNGGMAIAGIVLGVLSVLAAAAVAAAGVSFLNSESGRNLVECLDQATDQAEVEQCQREFEDEFTQ